MCTNQHGNAILRGCENRTNSGTQKRNSSGRGRAKRGSMLLILTIVLGKDLLDIYSWWRRYGACLKGSLAHVKIERVYVRVVRNERAYLNTTHPSVFILAYFTDSSFVPLAFPVYFSLGHKPYIPGIRRSIEVTRVA